ncbi:T9SS type A sorting domain-containing protein [Constantimarinum furrinae]|uniref:T9SS type A sorting domain-containing protein n=1 Tax=Constantimarinum furrinae TaxID=2562285 RepID=UPI00164B5A87|nr:T9SS type A sorting domain-containing protein [Constantimarinum furrinae]
MALILAVFASPAFAQGDCADLTVPVMAQMGLDGEPSTFNVVAGNQDGRIFRDGIATVCPGKVYPGNFNVGTTYNWTGITLYNQNAAATCITIQVDVDSGVTPCGTNGHAHVFQEAGGANMEPYDPMNQGDNFVGDVGSSASQPFNVEVEPGFFQVVFTNTASADNCDFSFTVPEAMIYCEEQLGVSSNELDAFVMSPNPASGNVNLTFPASAEVTSVQIYDVTGKLVQSNEVDGAANYNVSTDALVSGVYFVKVNSATASSSKKLIVR